MLSIIDYYFIDDSYYNSKCCQVLFLSWEDGTHVILNCKTGNDTHRTNPVPFDISVTYLFISLY